MFVLNMINSLDQNSLFKITLDKYGNPVSKNGETEQAVNKQYEQTSNFNHTYYKQGMNASFGPAGIVALIETLTGFVIWRNERKPAPLAAFLMSVAEYFSVPIARTALLGSGEIGKQRREGAGAHLQGIVGLCGIGSFIHQSLKEGETEEELSLTKKLCLTFASVVNSALMFFTFGEKALLSVTSKGIKNNECIGMALNAKSDLRTSLSWLTVGIYLWLSKIKPLKNVIDFLVPLLSLRDALAYYAEEGFSLVFKNSTNLKLPNGLRKFLSFITLMNGSGEFKNIPWIFDKNWFLSKGGFRDKYLIPIFQALGCKLPSINTNGKDGEYIVSIKPEDYVQVLQKN